MPALASAILDITQLELLAHTDTPVHRLDARAKVLVTLIFCGTIISFGKYELSALLPFAVFPTAMLAKGNLPARLIARKIALLCPFVLLVAIFNPFIDRTVVSHIGSIGITGGWLSFFSILTRSLLTVSSALILVGITGFTAICRALEKLAVPQAFVVQLLFLYRYIFVLAEEGNRVSKARGLRSFGTKGLGIAAYSSMIGHLLLRTWSRAERIHMAMQARGFDGEFRTIRQARFGASELMHLFGWTTTFMIFRFANGSRLLGTLLLGVMS